MTKIEQELQLLKDKIEWVQKQTRPEDELLIAYYQKYYNIAVVHKPIKEETWSDDGTFRHGWKGVRGTTSEMLTAFAVSGPLYRFEINQVKDKIEQKWGTDLRCTKGIKEYTISCKTCKLHSKFVDGQLHTFVILWRDYFKSADWRIDFLSLTHPETNQVWLFNYELLTNLICSVNHRGIPTPKFDGECVEFDITQYIIDNKNGVIYFNLNRKD
jgi:hypothetical protein